jgi:hypothetical protein
MSPQDSLLFLLLFVRSSFFVRVMILLMLSLISSQLFGVKLTLLVLNCLLPLVIHARTRRLLLSFIACMTSWFGFVVSLSLSTLSCLLVTLVCSLMDALAEVHNEETHLQDAGLLRVSSVLASRSSVARCAALMPPVSPLIAPFTAHGASNGIYCDHCGRDEHVEAFCYRKKWFKFSRIWEKFCWFRDT